MMPDDPSRAGQHHKPSVPEFWNVSFYRRIIQNTIARELKESIEPANDLPHRLIVLLMQLDQSSENKSG
jgi:hypothetical protein